MNRGSCAGEGQLDRTPGCFNEAPIHESGKCMACGSKGELPQGFNEAPIHESGKCWLPF